MSLGSALKPNIQFEAANFVTLTNFVKNTNSIGFAVKELISEELKNREVFELKTQIELPKTELFALLPKGSSNSYVCEKFYHFLIKNLKPRRKIWLG